MEDDRPPESIPGNATHLHRYELHKRFADRLRRTPEIDEVRAEPSSFRPTTVTARIDGTEFGSGPDGDLEIEWRPRDDEDDQFRIQFIPVHGQWSCGWHQDGTHEELGPAHIQLDHHEQDRARRSGARFDDGMPMAVLETCLDALREHGTNPKQLLESGA
ncbi:MAG: hypothetical protein M8354_11795 [Halalkalicoccus sp.]|nr:hypothetical protein [Halalkalicoccus sp.]